MSCPSTLGAIISATNGHFIRITDSGTYLFTWLVSNFTKYFIRICVAWHEIIIFMFVKPNSEVSFVVKFIACCFNSSNWIELKEGSTPPVQK